MILINQGQAWAAIAEGNGQSHGQGLNVPSVVGSLCFLEKKKKGGAFEDEASQQPPSPEAI